MSHLRRNPGIHHRPDYPAAPDVGPRQIQAVDIRKGAKGADPEERLGKRYFIHSALAQARLLASGI